MKKSYWLVCSVILLIIICGFLFASFYSAAKNGAIRDLNKQQSLLAIQAARGIEDFFGNWTRILETYSSMDNIVDLDNKGKQYMALLYEANKEQIRSVIRVDANGRIIHTTPYSQESIGKDISRQKHIQEIIRTRKPVVSEVFKTVQGFDAVALHVPVFRNKTYDGSIGIAVNFASLSKRYVEGIKIGKTGYAWMISRDGTELFCPVPGHTGNSVFENCKDFPSIMAMADEMLKGHQGVTTYSFDKIAGQTVKPVKKHAVYMPVPIGNTFWSIVVASSEDEVLASLAEFRDKLLLIIGLILFGATLFTYYGGKAWFIIKEEEKRKRVEEAVQEEQRRLEEIIDFLPDATLVIDKTGKVTAWNRAIEKMTGVKAEEMIGKGEYEYAIPFYGERRPILIDLALLSDDEFLTGHYDDIHRQGAILSGEVFVPKTYGGKGAYLWATASTLFNADGNIIGAIESIHDITKRKSLEEALRDSEECYRVLIELSPDAIFIHTGGKLIFANREGAKLLGVEQPGDIYGREALDIVHPDSREFVQQRIARAFQSGEPTPPGEMMFVRVDGSQVPVEVVSVPFRYQGENALLAIARDITERRRMQDELLKAQKLESLGLLAGGIAHDFNNILTGIVGNISIAKLQLDPSHKIVRRLELCEKAAMQATELTRQLLTFARGGEPVKRLINPASLIRETVSFALRGSNILSIIDIQDNLWSMEVDESQLNQVLNNLLLNAGQAMPAGGEITVRAANETLLHDNPHQLPLGDYLRIAVEDRGCGISQENLVRIFDPYFTTKPKGSGLGLASVYSIVKRHGGAVEVSSTLAAGTTFSIHLPALPGRLPEDEVAKVSSELSGSGRVLIMDDEDLICDVATCILGIMGYEVDSCADGQEAVERFRAAREKNVPFSAVILDLTIPGGMGGKEAASRILEIDPDAVLIVSSGYSDDPVIANFRQYGFSGVVPKPFDTEGLAKELKRLIPKTS
jgi:two-component system cell cycle sensor histidine kinase/response regulator CckA